MSYIDTACLVVIAACSLWNTLRFARRDRDAERKIRDVLQMVREDARRGALQEGRN